MLAHIFGRENQRQASPDASKVDRSDFAHSATAYGTAPALLFATDVTINLTIPMIVQHARSVKRRGRMRV
jgi:hypothetical protein